MLKIYRVRPRPNSRWIAVYPSLALDAQVLAASLQIVREAVLNAIKRRQRERNRRVASHQPDGMIIPFIIRDNGICITNP